MYLRLLPSINVHKVSGDWKLIYKEQAALGWGEGLLGSQSCSFASQVPLQFTQYLGEAPQMFGYFLLTGGGFLLFWFLCGTELDFWQGWEWRFLQTQETLQSFSRRMLSRNGRGIQLELKNTRRPHTGSDHRFPLLCSGHLLGDRLWHRSQAHRLWVCSFRILGQCLTSPSLSFFICLMEQQRNKERRWSIGKQLALTGSAMLFSLLLGSTKPCPSLSRLLGFQWTSVLPLRW